MPTRPTRGDPASFSAAGGGEDGYLCVDEIDRMKLAADLVVLSGCRTGIGAIRPGEGAIHIARAFLAAGAKQIVMTL
jgi:CHAT domain-containing protein